MKNNARYLADTSAILKLTDPRVAAVLGPLIEAGEVATCGVVDLELYALVRDPAELAGIRAWRAAAFPWLEMTDQDLLRALQVQAAMPERGYNNAGTPQKVGWPELLTAAVAERHSVTVLHANPWFEQITKVTGQAVEWVRRQVGD